MVFVSSLIAQTNFPGTTAGSLGFRPGGGSENNIDKKNDENSEEEKKAICELCGLEDFEI